jgi:hypothetical protein
MDMNARWTIKDHKDNRPMRLGSARRARRIVATTANLAVIMVWKWSSQKVLCSVGLLLLQEQQQLQR